MWIEKYKKEKSSWVKAQEAWGRNEIKFDKEWQEHLAEMVMSSYLTQSWLLATNQQSSRKGLPQQV